MCACLGLLLRMFMNLYNLEVIDEDAFMQWKEELNDIHPGKGQALFQVSSPGCTCILHYQGGRRGVVVTHWSQSK